MKRIRSEIFRFYECVIESTSSLDGLQGAKLLSNSGPGEPARVAIMLYP
jgi:hypothetical protein